MATIDKAGFPFGIDQSAAKGKTAPGHVEFAQDMNPTLSGEWETRQGYEGHYGWLPHKVSKIELDGTTTRLYIGTSTEVDLSAARRGPIIVYGRDISDAALFFGETQLDWYATWTLSNRRSLTSPSGTLTVTNTEHGLGTSDFLVAFSESTSSTEADHAQIAMSDIRINTTSFEIAADYVVPDTTDAYIYFKKITTGETNEYKESIATFSTTFTRSGNTITLAAGTLEIGESVELTTTGTLPSGLSTGTIYYVVSYSGSTVSLSETFGGAALTLSSAGSGTHTLNKRGYKIAATTHNLSTVGLFFQVFDTAINAGNATQVTPSDVWKDTSGNLWLHFTADVTGYVLMTSNEPDQLKTVSATVSGGGPTLNTFTIDAPGATFNFVECWVWDATANAYYNTVPADVTYDESSDQLTLSYYMSGASGEEVVLYWLNAISTSNIIEVTTPTDLGTGTDDNCWFWVWGIDHADSYTDAATKGGHVQLLKEYTNAGELEPRLVAAVGGNLLQESSYEDGASIYLMGTKFPLMTYRLSTARLLAPLFHTTNPGSVRTRGVIYDTSVDSDGGAVVTTAAYVSSGVVDYTLSFTSKSGTLALASQVDTYDQLTVSGMPHSALNGNFQIQTVTDNGTTVVIRVANSSVTSTRYDTAGCKGRAGVYTDRLVISSENTTVAVPGTQLISSAIDTDLNLTIFDVSLNDDYLFIKNITESVNLPEGVLLGMKGTLSAFPVGTSEGTANIEGLVPGDMLRVSSLDDAADNEMGRRVRIKAIHFASESSYVTATVTGTGTVATGTFSSAHGLEAGDKFIAKENNSALYKEVEVLTAPSTTTITFSSTETSGSLTILQKQIQLDEAISVQGGAEATQFTVDGRWVPVPLPRFDVLTLGGDQNSAMWRQASYGQQPRLRASLVNNVLYMINNNDEVVKFDGDFVFHAGLPRLDPIMFGNQTTSDITDTLPNPAAYTTGTVTAAWTTGNYFQTTVDAFDVGDRVYLVQGGSNVLSSYIVRKDLNKDGSNNYTYYLAPEAPMSSISWTASTISAYLTQTYQYYARVNYVDTHGQLHASAAIGIEDHSVDYSQTTGAIQLKLINPFYGMELDIERIEVEIYRKAPRESNWNLLFRKTAAFSYTTPYFTLKDGVDPILIDGRDDVVHSALKGAELGTAWDKPPRAACISATGSRLLLGNIKGWPECSVVFYPPASRALATQADFTGVKLLIRKDSTDTGTATNMIDRILFEFVQASSALTINGISTTAHGASGDNIATVTTSASHNLSVGHWVYLFHHSSYAPDLVFCGWYQVRTVPSGTTFTINTEVTYGASVSSARPTRCAVATAKTDIPVVIDLDGNFGFRDGDLGTSNTPGQMAIRLSKACNAVMRACNLSVSGFEDFIPWLSAHAGNDLRFGEVNFVVPVAISTTPEFIVTANSDVGRIFLNDEEAVVNTAVSFLTVRYPSRVLRSYPNYPEIFDDPFGQNSDSIIDIDADGGQELTAIAPIFGDAASSSSQVAQSQVAFKKNAIYLFDPETKQVQRINTRGIGCDAPDSVASVPGGIFFTYQGEQFFLNDKMQLTRPGLWMRKWVTENVNKAEIEQQTGIFDGVSQRYILSTPVNSGTVNSHALVHDFSLAEQGGGKLGAWTTWSNFPSTYWAQKEGLLHFASTAGDVFRIRNRNEAQDYRDEDQAIDGQELLLPAEHFDVPGIRKRLRYITTHWELPLTDLTDIVLKEATNKSDTLTETGTFSLEKEDTKNNYTIRTSLFQKKAQYFQIQVTLGTKDEKAVFTGISYEVDGLSYKRTRTSSDEGS